MEKEAEEDMSFREKMQSEIYRGKFIYTLVLFASFAFLGVRHSQDGTAFLDLAQITGTNVEKASIFYTARGVGGMAGTFIMGFLFDKLPPRYRPMLLVLTCALGAATTVALPWSTIYIATIVIFFINAVFQSGLDTGSHASLMATWGRGGKSYMQFMHFCYSVGTIISPFTVQPFLSRYTSGNATYCHSMHNILPTSNDVKRGITNYTVSAMSQANVTLERESSDCVLSESWIHYAYLIGGLSCLLSAILFAVHACVYRAEAKRETATLEDHRNQRVLSFWPKMAIFGLMSLIFFFHFASTWTIVGYLMPFCVDGLGWSKDEGTFLTSAMSAGIAASRLTAVLVVKFLRPVYMMILSNSIVLVSLAGLWISVVYDSYWGIVVCIISNAFGFSVILPTGISYLENDVMKVTGRVTALVWISGNLQGVVLPPLIGYLLQEVSYMWFIYLSLIEAVISLTAFGILVLVVKTRFAQPKDNDGSDTAEEKNTMVRVET